MKQYPKKGERSKLNNLYWSPSKAKKKLKDKAKKRTLGK
jgi:hypothetical protein